MNADYELMLRFLEVYKIKAKWINKTFVNMNAGGKSNNGVKSRINGVVDNFIAWKVNDLKPSIITIMLKKIRKIPQYIIALFFK